MLDFILYSIFLFAYIVGGIFIDRQLYFIGRDIDKTDIQSEIKVKVFGRISLIIRISIIIGIVGIILFAIGGLA